jgi:branched-chain amino acid transport system ATP-binding protein
MNLCQRIIVLEMGRKIAEGPPEEVRANQRVIQAYLGAGKHVA